MKIKYNLVHDKKDKIFQQLLDKYSIRYKITMNIITTSIYEEETYWEEINQYIKKSKIPTKIETVFSKTDLKKAEWFRLRSGWFWDYPKPDSDMGFRKSTYDIEKYCTACGAIMSQKENFKIKGEPSWGNKSILQLNWIYDELFVKPDVYETMISKGISGITKQNVLKYSDNKTLNTVIQLKIENRLNQALIKNDKIRVIQCRTCKINKHEFNYRGMVSFSKNILKNQYDFNKTKELFGAEGNKIALPYIIVSKKVYDLFEDNNWKQPIFEPINLID